MSSRDRFERLARDLDEDERQQIADASRRDPGEKIEESLRLWAASLSDYRRMLEQPWFARMEDERAVRKADLHELWRERHGTAR
jgi:hypothetical protein